MKEIKKVFCLKYLNMFSVPLQMLAVCVGYFFIEAMSRHSIWNAWEFLQERPLVFFYNAFLIFTTTLIVYLFRRRRAAGAGHANDFVYFLDGTWNY